MGQGNLHQSYKRATRRSQRTRRRREDEKWEAEEGGVASGISGGIPVEKRRRVYEESKVKKKRKSWGKAGGKSLLRKERVSDSEKRVSTFFPTIFLRPIWMPKLPTRVTFNNVPGTLNSNYYPSIGNCGKISAYPQIKSGKRAFYKP